MSIKLDHHHRATAQKLLCPPLNHNIQWHDVCSLLGRFGEVHETHRGNWAVTVEGETHSFGSTKNRELTEEQVMKVRSFLRAFGLTKESLKAA
ncbi:MAG TPA: hypothetical protein VNE22_02110 [Acidimicrobiales bacterium]|nr:hypothetical protein [Acidimicrobiales bacterium]